MDSITGRFAAVVSRHGDRPAVRMAGEEWSYAELDRRSDAIAGLILAHADTGEGPVGLCHTPGAPLIAAILGVLKSGRPYLVLDPEDPVLRLEAVVQESRLNLILSDAAHANLAEKLCPASGRRLDAGQAGEQASGLPKVPPETGAWLMFTSGSTDAPKGVWQDHAGVVHHADVYRELIGLTPEDRLSLVTSFGLAASTTHLFAALLNGAMLCPFAMRSDGVARMAEWIRASRITVYHSVPTVFRRMARTVAADQGFEALRIIRLGGEPMLPADLELFRRHCPSQCRLMHVFSSTETGLVSVRWIEHAAAAAEARLHMGRPVRDVTVLLLDEEGQPVSAGGEGRIAVAGVGVARGYWNQPALTQQAFRPDPNCPSSRIFVTGDLGRFDGQGNLEYLGRIDFQVKIRGQRVDLLLVETTLRGLDEVEDAAVIARDEAGEVLLVAYVVPRRSVTDAVQACRRWLRVTLPSAMLPDRILSLTELPLTPSGKVDRRGLQQRPIPRPAPGRYRRTPRDGIEKRIAGIWEGVLGVTGIGREDDFFDLGGTSLDTVQILARIDDEFDLRLPPQTLVERQTIEQLADLVASRAVSAASAALVKLRDNGTGQPLILVHGGKGDITMYGQLAKRLPGRPVYAFQAIGLNGESWPLTSIPAMAGRYLRELIDMDPTGPYLLAGTCMGGLIAFEMAQQLTRSGREVGLLALIDSDFPARVGRRLRMSERVVEPVRDAMRILRWGILRSGGFGRSRRWLPAYRKFVHNMNARARRGYRPCPYPGVITLLLASDASYHGVDLRLILRGYARESRVVSIAGRRADLFHPPAVDSMARQLTAAMEGAT